MSAILPESETRSRREVTAPDMHAWVSANAGSGKTSILRDKVVRLLLAGVEPQRILCLTFTKAAAAEMQGRIFQELARWTLMADDALAGELSRLTETKTPPPALLANARRLFAEAIETPGGLKIQTIHAFAERVLQLCPIEAGVPVRFTVLDDMQAGALRAQARKAVVEAAAQAPASPLGMAFREVLRNATSAGFETAITQALALLAQGEAGGVVDRASEELRYRHVLGLPAKGSRDDVMAAILAELPGRDVFGALAEAILAKKPSDNQRKRAALLNAIAEQGVEAHLAPFRDDILVFPKDGGPHLRAYYVPANVIKARPELADDFAAAAQTMIRVVDAERAFAILDQSLALEGLASTILARYRREKRLRAMLDFDDLITALRRLLESGHAGWVMMKLDSAIDHVLVDEAQDTSRAMWDIVLALTQEFFVGAGQVQRRRSIFVVGDEKQSIYSFQGAEPRAFEDARLAFAERIEAAGQPNAVRKPRPLLYSFRSSPVVLGAVDAVFQGERAKGLGAQLGIAPGTNLPATCHNAAFPEKPGLVELWPLERDPPRDEAGEGSIPEDAPVDTPRTRAIPRLAARIAARIDHWLTNRTARSPGEKPISAGDILILVQQRGPLFQAILKALKRRGVPVAGADRMQLADELGVHDLLIAAESALLPTHDLALATLLRSPFFGISDGELEGLARGRSASLHAALQEAARTDARWAAIFDGFERLREAARMEDPYGFFMDLLTRPHPFLLQMSGRQSLLTRLGRDAEEAVRAFLDQALAFSSASPGSLVGFLAAQRASGSVVKRDMEASGDAVRVMTVHGAKGLEAPIVFLPDTTRKPDRGKEPNVLTLSAEGAPLLVWSLVKTAEPEALRAERAQRRDAQFGEYRRLLYVATTRASERLYICGHDKALSKAKAEAEGKTETDLHSRWYDLISEGFPADATEIVEGVDEEGVERVILRSGKALDAESPTAPALQETMPVVPAMPPIRAEARVVRSLAPSRLSARQEGAKGAGDEGAAGAMDRGLRIHRLFEILPRLPEAEREAAYLRISRTISPLVPESVAHAEVASVMACLALPQLACFFAPEARAEVPLAGRVHLPGGGSRAVMGRIDRLVVMPQEVLVLDIKTSARDSRMRPAILGQMALYCRLLEAIYPEKTIRPALLWVGEPALEWLDDETLTRAFAEIGVDSAITAG